MKVIVPLEMTDAQLISTNVSETTYSDWDAGTTYEPDSSDVYDIVQKNHKLYVAKIASTVGEDPETTPASWNLIGATNAWKMFDPLRPTIYPTENADTIEIEVVPSGAVNAVAFFGLEALSVNIILMDGTSEVYNNTIDTFSLENISNWHGYFFDVPTRTTRAVVFDLPTVSDPTLLVTIDYTGSTAKCGKMIMGDQKALGCTMFGVKGRRRNLSIQERDDFGNLVLNQRRTIKTRSFNVRLYSSRIDWVDQVLSTLYGSPTVFVGSENWAFTIFYGLLMDTELSLDEKIHSSLPMTVEEI